MDNNSEKKLNASQSEAVQHIQGPALIVAGAGTGKTTVLIERLQSLFKNKLARPDEILLLTFTEKGAGEMEDRALKILPLGYFDLWINTFHGFTERVLREHALDIGLSPAFKLLTQTEQWILIKKNLDKFKLDYYRPLGNPNKFIYELVKHFSRLKDENISAKEYLAYAEDLLSSADTMLCGQIPLSKKPPAASAPESQEIKRINELAHAYHVYNNLLLENEYLDFGDLIFYAIRLFQERPQILQYYQAKFKFIMVDEFQDTNTAQYELIKILAGNSANLMVVGDDDQAIYRFRGASLSNIMQFKEDYPLAKEVVLGGNYRSTQEILDNAYRSIAHNNPNRLEIKLNINKKLQAQKSETGILSHINFADYSSEAEWIAQKIKALHKQEGLKWSACALLVRANSDADAFAGEFARQQIPNTFVSLKGLYFKPVILDVLAFLRLLDNYHESAALFRVLNMAAFAIDHADIVNISRFARKKIWSLYEALKNIEAVPGLESAAYKNAGKLIALVSRFSELVKKESASRVFVKFIYESGILNNKDFDRDREFFSHLNQFYKKIKTFEDSAPEARLKDFLEYFNLEIEAGETGALRLDYEDEDTVKIMTVHAAKGLEFDTVFLPCLVDKKFPTINRAEKIPIPDELVKIRISAGKDAHLEEERRLFYVALTRARRNLFLTSAKDYGGKREKKPSVFLAELGLAMQENGRKSGASEIAKALDDFASPILAHAFKFTPPQKYSFSQAEAFANCPLQYKFNFILNIPVLPKSVFIFGRVIHNTLRDFFLPLAANNYQAGLFDAHPGLRKKLAYQDLEKAFNLHWQNDGYESAKERDDYKQQGREMLKAVFAYYEKSGWPTVAFIEKNFLVKIGDYIFKGAIDRVDKLPDNTYEILDYKTGSPKDKLAYSDKRQLLLYKIVLEEGMGLKVSNLAYFYLKSGEKTGFQSTAKDEEKLKAELFASIQGINKGEFLPKPSMLCNYCDFNNICEFRQKA